MISLPLVLSLFRRSAHSAGPSDKPTNQQTNKPANQQTNRATEQQSNKATTNIPANQQTTQQQSDQQILKKTEKTYPKWINNLLKITKMAPKLILDGFFGGSWGQNNPKTTPRDPPGPTLEKVWSIFDRFLIDFGYLFDALL